MDAGEADEDTLVRAMIGRSVERFFDTHAQKRNYGPVLLSVEGLTRQGAFEDICFEVRSGEIVGLAGLMGAGRTEVARAIFGIDPFDRGTVRVAGTEVHIVSPKDAIAAGIVLVPEERKSQGLVLDRSISDNIVLPHLRDLSVAGVFNEERLEAYSRRVVQEVGVKAAGVRVAVRTLSGGNQQKVVLGRWLTSKPKVYILDEPTRGIDVQAKTEIYQQIGRLANQGAAVVVISSDLPELLGTSHRILVMRFGRLVGQVDAAIATERALLQLAMVDEFLQPPKDAARVTDGGDASPYVGLLPLPDGPIGDPKRRYTFALSQALTGSAWATTQRDSFVRAAARHPNVDVITRNTDNDAGQQVIDIEDCITRKADALIVWPSAVAPLTVVIEKARHAGIVVVGMERNVATRAYDSWIWLDFPGATNALAQAAARKLEGRGTIVEVLGTTGSSSAILRHDGFAKALKLFPKIRLVTTRATDWSAEAGYQVALGALRSLRTIDAWYVHDSEIARGVSRAMAEIKRADIPIFTCVDSMQSLVDVQEGRLFAVAPWTPLHGDIAFRAAAYHIQGFPVPKDILLVQPEVITQANVQDWMRRTWDAARHRDG